MHPKQIGTLVSWYNLMLNNTPKTVSGNKIRVKCHLWKTKENNYSYDIQFASTSSEVIKER